LTTNVIILKSVQNKSYITQLATCALGGQSGIGSGERCVIVVRSPYGGARQWFLAGLVVMDHRDG
jgi:hypothetical protein